MDAGGTGRLRFTELSSSLGAGVLGAGIGVLAHRYSTPHKRSRPKLLEKLRSLPGILLPQDLPAPRSVVRYRAANA
jgi:hypothetical protein